MPFVKEQDTSYVNELRFYKIRTARKTAWLMKRKFGKWDETIAGKYQENINRHIWRDVKLFKDLPPFTVITDGTKTGDAYFVGVMEFDADSNDCLITNHELRDRLVQFFY